METAEDRKISMEDKGQDMTDKYDRLCEDIDRANNALDEFESNYQSTIITLKNGEKIQINSALDLDKVRLDKRQIKDIQFIPNLEGNNINELVTYLAELQSTGNASEDVIHAVRDALVELLSLDPGKFESFLNVLK